MHLLSIPTATHLLLLPTCLLSLTSAFSLVLPAPNGPHAVTHSTAHLIDPSRSISYDPSHGPRDIMISLFYPVPRAECSKMCVVPYMPSLTTEIVDQYAVANYGVPEGTMTGVGMEVCCELEEKRGHGKEAKSKKGKNDRGVPVILLQPGLTNSRHQHNYQAMNLASAGYAVVTMDHPHETLITEFPDGNVTLGVDEEHWDYENWPNLPVMQEQLGIRVKDAEFVLEQLGRGDVVAQLLPKLAGQGRGERRGKRLLNTKNAAIFGHSFGGAAAVAALTRPHTPFAGAVQMDGWQPPLPPSSKITRPVLLFGRADHYNGDDSWVDLWSNLRGWKKELRLKESMHNTFGGDLAFLFKLRGVPVTETTVRATGRLEGERGFGVIGGYVRGFMGMVLRGEEGGLLEGGSEEYPEIEILR